MPNIGNLTGLVFSTATLVAAIGALVVGLIAIRKINVIKHETNGMKRELIAEVRMSEHAKGLKEGLEQLKQV